MYWNHHSYELVITGNELIDEDCLITALSTLNTNSLLNIPPILNLDWLVCYFASFHSGCKLSRHQCLNMHKRKLINTANSPDEFYRLISIPKSNGSKRYLHIPIGRLKTFQHWILKNILSQLPISNFAYAYRKGASICECAKKHSRQKMVMRLDIKDFFGSIHINKVYNIFFHTCGYSKKMSYILALLCTSNGFLPQGACTSPCISNLIFYNIDNLIANYCSSRQITYTRYCDDLYFSGSFAPKTLMGKIESALEYNDFKLNSLKTKLMTRGSRQSVLGIVVNNSVRVNRNYRKNIRQEIYFIKKFGVRQHIININAVEYIANKKVLRKKYLFRLLGKIRYVLSISLEKEMREYESYIIDCLAQKQEVGYYSPLEYNTYYSRRDD